MRSAQGNGGTRAPAYGTHSSLWEGPLIPSLITSALSTLQAHAVPCLLMGGQACVLYGGAEFSRDLDLVIATHPGALTQLQTALADLRAAVIAVPPLRLDLLERGDAVHFRCQRADVARLRIDVLARPPRITDLAGLWARRVVVSIPAGASVPVIALADLVAAKKNAARLIKGQLPQGAMASNSMCRHATGVNSPLVCVVLMRVRTETRRRIRRKGRNGLSWPTQG